MIVAGGSPTIQAKAGNGTDGSELTIRIVVNNADIRLIPHGTGQVPIIRSLKRPIHCQLVSTTGRWF